MAYDMNSKHQYGPYVRIKSPTQTLEVAEEILLSGEIWGHPAKIGGLFPAAKAFLGELCFPNETDQNCHNSESIEFETDAMPAKSLPNGEVRWYIENAHNIPTGHKVIDDETTAIIVQVTKIYYISYRSEVYDAENDKFIYQYSN